MKKLLAIVIAALILFGCSKSDNGAQFVGTWKKGQQVIVITSINNNYSVTMNNSTTYPAKLEEQILKVTMPVYGEVPLSLRDGNLIFDGYPYSKSQ